MNKSDLITLNAAAIWASKYTNKAVTISNISYLVQYALIDKVINNERIYKIIASEIKKRKDAIELYLKANREDLAQKEQNEISLFEIYLPKQLSDEELTLALKQLIEELGVSSLKEQGLVMKEAKIKLGASVDGKRLNLALKELLQ